MKGLVCIGLSVSAAALGNYSYVEHGASVVWPGPYIRVGKVMHMSDYAEVDIAGNFTWGLVVWPSISASAGLQIKASTDFSWGPEATIGLAHFRIPYGHGGARFKWRTSDTEYFTTYVGACPMTSWYQDAYVYVERYWAAPVISFGWVRTF